MTLKDFVVPSIIFKLIIYKPFDKGDSTNNFSGFKVLSSFPELSPIEIDATESKSDILTTSVNPLLKYYLHIDL